MQVWIVTRHVRPWLQIWMQLGLLVKVVPHNHSVGTHDRCGTTVEPMIKPQWFVRMDKMAKAAIDALKTRRTGICSCKFWQDISSLAGEHPRLVYFPSALVGTQNPGLLL